MESRPYILERKKTINSNFFHTEQNHIKLIFTDRIENLSEDPVEALDFFFQYLLEDIVGHDAPTDRVQMIIQNEDMEVPIATPFLMERNLNTSQIYKGIEKAKSFGNEIKLEGTLDITVKRVCLNK